VGDSDFKSIPREHVFQFLSRWHFLGFVFASCCESDGDCTSETLRGQFHKIGAMEEITATDFRPIARGPKAPPETLQ
jgi:hypothetical protein